MNFLFDRNNRFPIIVCCLFLIFTAFSCKKFVAVDPPKNQLVSSTVFTSDATATSAMVGVYSKIMGDFGLHFLSGGLTIYPALSADELLSNNSFYDEFRTNSITVSNSAVLSMWDEAYQYIYDVNAIIEGLDHSTQVSEGLKKQLTGEAKVVRSLCYFYLINIFGDAPLITTTDYQTNENLPRTNSDDIYQFIVNDLKDAEGLLSSDYVSGERTRPNKWTATSLLARVYLYEKDWKNAEAEAGKIIQSGSYTLSQLDGVFLKNSSETIWQLIPVSYGFVWDAYYMIPSIGIPNFQITPQLLTEFETGDQRRNVWVDSIITQGATYYYPYKYKSKQFFTSIEYLTVFRLAEQYLIRAEARAEDNDITRAASDINIIRNRAGLPNTVANTKSDLLAAIEHERRIELFAEWGHRWLDLKRTNMTSDALSYKPGWSSTDIYYPIPQIETERNTSLTQNDGY